MRKKRKNTAGGLCMLSGIVCAMGGAETWSQGDYLAALLPIGIGLVLMLAALVLQEAQKKSARKAATSQGAVVNNHFYIVAGNGRIVK